ncbi:hypothetical protein GLOTRDRAFT_63954 [Gloeophyllum trabeum ATCC 11539]|uniref:Uncharacterized protein n=1 Tax=Gloeophyllum trabeum (strain ATCC 11539 / FP-39264 / Madison 617) TaxID=670483 RepID=S7Q011_GLOTA|nr:uncharacterized protein GLOTRDRAFT_63954 [Gloeophyllum trabeum ATCC 11539]EPQ53266.1 hypothetical protein GLOTRDRAFT_63954 [Gloeophyllum trabeum ATCC 11539]
MSDSSASTPALLTPESTGSSAPSSTAEIKKSRRQTAFYPNMNKSAKPQKPFSRSAAKRESVMALGSIEHLQHYFTKTGLSAQQETAGKQKKGLVPAIGGLQNISTQVANQLGHTELPPTPAVPQVERPAFPPYVKTFETNPEALRAGVVDDLISVAHAWELDDGPPAQHTDLALLGVKGEPTGNVDVLNLLKISTHAVRSVRNYLISLPDDSIVRIRDDFRPKVTPSKPIVKRQASPGNMQSDPLMMIRRAALEVLTVLRELEEKSRLPLSDDAYDAQSDHGSSSHDAGSHSRVASPSNLAEDTDHEDAEPAIAFSLVKVRGRDESIPVWEDDTVDMNDMSAEEMEKRERWDERLVLGGGWLYKQDIRMENLRKEKEAMQRYLDLVDDVLFGGRKNGRRGWERERASKSKGRRVSAGDVEGYMDSWSRRSSRRVVSAGMIDQMRDLTLSEEPEQMESLAEEEEGESVDEDELPEWAKRSAFENDPLGRAHAVLSELLPEHLRSKLPPAPPDRSALLLALSSGQLLCVSYNAGVRRSRKPWGFINKDEIHDILAMEQGLTAEEKAERNRTGWTYRRLDNLRLWSGGLKLRYSLPIHILPKPGVPLNLNVTPTPSPQPSPGLKTKFSSAELPFTFDTRTIARKDNGWEEMLETAVVKWANAVAEEQRGER